MDELDDLGRSFNYSHSYMNILFLSVKSFIGESNGIHGIRIKLLIEFLQISYLLFNPKFTHVWVILGFKEPQNFVYMLTKLAAVVPFVIDGNYISLYTLLNIAALISLSIGFAFAYYFINKKKNLKYSNIFCEKLLSFFLQMIPILIIPLLYIVFRSIYCVNGYLRLVDESGISSINITESLLANYTGPNTNENTQVECFSLSHLIVFAPGIIIGTFTFWFAFMYSYFFFYFMNFSFENNETIVGPSTQKLHMLHKILLFVVVELGSLYLDNLGAWMSTLQLCIAIVILFYNQRNNYFISSKARKSYLVYYTYLAAIALLNQFRIGLVLFDLGEFQIYFEAFILLFVFATAFVVRYRLMKTSYHKPETIANENAALQAIFNLQRQIFHNLNQKNKSKIEMLGYLIHHNSECLDWTCPLKYYQQKLMAKFNNGVGEVSMKNGNGNNLPKNVAKKRLSKHNLASERLSLVQNESGQLNESYFSFHSNIVNVNNPKLNEKMKDRDKKEIDLEDESNKEQHGILDDSDFEKRIFQYLVYHQEQMYDRAIIRFPFSFELKFFYVMYLVYVYANYDKALQKIEDLASDNSLPLSQRYMVFVFHMKISELLKDRTLILGLEMNTSKNANEIKNVLFFQKLSTAFKSEVEKISISFQKFWGCFTTNMNSLSEILASGLCLIHNIKSLFACWGMLEKYNLADSQIFWIYGMFLSDVLDEKALGKLYIEKSKASLLSFKDNTLNFSVNSALTKGSSTCIAVSKEGEGAVIGRVSLSFAKTFGYQASELEGKNVNIFLPSIFHQKHNQLIHDFTLNTQYDSRKLLRGYAVHKSGYIMHIQTNITKVPSFKYDNSFLVRMIQVSYQQYGGKILADQMLNICYVSSEIPRMFEMSEKETLLLKNSYKLEAKDKFNLTEFIQELYISVDDFIQCSKERNSLSKKSELSVLKAEFSKDKYVAYKNKRADLENQADIMLRFIIKAKLNLFKRNGNFVKSDCKLVIGNFNRKANTYGSIKVELIRFLTEQLNLGRLNNQEGFYKKLIHSLRASKMMTQPSSNKVLSFRRNEYAGQKISTEINRSYAIGKSEEVDMIIASTANNEVSPTQKGRIELKQMKFGDLKSDFFMIDLILDYNFKSLKFVEEDTLPIKSNFMFKFDLSTSQIKISIKPKDDSNFSGPQSGRFLGSGLFQKNQMILIHEKKNCSRKENPNFKRNKDRKVKIQLSTIQKRRSQSFESIANTEVNNQELTLGSFFGCYSHNILYYKVDINNDFKLTKLISDEKIDEFQFHCITQEAVMLRDDDDEGYEQVNSADGENQKIEVRKSEIFSNAIKVKNTELVFLKALSLSILALHLAFTLSNYILVTINCEYKYNLVKIMYNSARMQNYSMSAADSLLNCLVLNSPNFNKNLQKQMQSLTPKFANFTIEQLTDVYIMNLRFSALNLFNIGNIISYDLINYNNYTLYWTLQNQIQGLMSTQIKTRFPEAISQIYATSALIGLSNTQIYTLKDDLVFSVLYNLMNTLSNCTSDLNNEVLGGLQKIEEGYITYIIIIISSILISILFITCFVLLKMTVTKMNKISIELLCINSTEAQTIINSAQSFIRLAKSQIMGDEEIDCIEEEPVYSEIIPAKKAKRVKNEVSRSKLYSIASIFLLYFGIMFVHHFEVLRTYNFLTIELNTNIHEAQGLSTYIHDTFLPALYFKIDFIKFNNQSNDSSQANFTVSIETLMKNMIISYTNINSVISKFNRSLLNNAFMSDFDFHANTSESTILEDTDYFIYDTLFSQLSYFSNRTVNSTASSIINVMTDPTDTSIPLFTLLYIGSKDSSDSSYSSGTTFLNVWLFVNSSLIIMSFILMWIPSEKYILNENLNLKMIILLLPNRLLRRRPKMISIMKEENLISYTQSN